ncbi:hypothetical protein JI750_17685 [Flavobacterium sp. GN10]|uniref:Intein N-terminal splicing region n=1 Tax=Flavobacterium tagetis TaxID=2801336 RepID=A0ABS1KHP6_9FLAO|nr:hypothetical protein [Flavobacterium tagetis]MBL0738732.1 hypothetical protein [Flavobacterium tagetis]
MSLIKKNLLSFVLFFILFQNIEAKDIEITSHNCKEKEVNQRIEFKSRYKYFFFRRTNHKKVKRIDEIIDENGKILIKAIMKSTERGDEYLFQKFHRLLITDKEIHEVTCVVGKESGKVIVYNFCGEKIKEFSLKSEELFEKYKF